MILLNGVNLRKDCVGDQGDARSKYRHQQSHQREHRQNVSVDPRRRVGVEQDGEVGQMVALAPSHLRRDLNGFAAGGRPV